ncbi:FAD-binding oxidoreductase [Kribbella sp. VKM Ac-2568]|uniref:FAD-binding oxidoreductase n=1 Tax=Kribbella sp. VKM Ac-2568 TaxID=2512219 RepID=UPI00104318BF|nr:FAD-binding oxidoreductase [Kribbella sp. VKM Ac-2568]TCM45079.1 FAD/FMN-containing dehydrogenase [Kribbella sp. VKM Ac-2568]
MTLTPQLLEVLRTHIAGRVVGADDPAWDLERGAWHLLADQRPAAVVHVTGADDIAATIRFARRHELAVSAQPVGHGASPAVNGTILLRTGGLTAIDVDIASGVVRVEAGVRWRDLNDALTGTGLTSLPGSSGDTTVVGYTLGGGLSWFGRKYGQAANTVRSFELVNARGDFQRVTHESDPELFWALRGGGGEFGIIVAMELELRLAPEIQGGRMLWSIEHARDVLRAFADVTATAPDELTLWAWLLNLPDVPFVPEPLRGRWVAAVDSTFLGSEEDSEKLLAPLRAVAEPIADTVARVPLSELGSIAQEPDEPVPGLLKTVLLSGFDSDAIDSLLEVAAPGTPSPLFAFEVRHFGGALARPDASQGVAGVIEEPYFLLFGGFVAGPGMAEVIEAAIEGVEAKMSPWITGHNTPNFSTTEPLTALYSADSLARLGAIKHRVDPHATIRGNRPIA